MAPTKWQHIRSQIRALVKSDFSYREIAKKLRINKTSVQKWAKMKDGIVCDKPRSGRPTKISPKTKQRIRNLTEDQVGVGIRTVSKKLNFSDSHINRGKRIGVTTVSDHVKSMLWGRLSYKQQLKPMLSAKNVEDRVSFCQWMICDGFADNSQLGKIKRAHILFIDESLIELHDTPNHQNRRIRTADPSTIPQVPVTKFPLKIMVAGGITRYGKTNLHVIPEGKTVDGDYYRTEILPSYIQAMTSGGLCPHPSKAVLMQDGVRAHTAKATLELLKKHNFNVWPDWPGNSPDFNVIEHVWARLQESCFKEPCTRNRQQLNDRVQNE